MKKRSRLYPVWFFLRRYRKLYTLLLLATIGYTILESVNISIFYPIFNTVLTNGKPSNKLFLLLSKIISFFPFKDYFINVCVFAIIILVVKEVLAFIRHSLTGYGIGKVVCDVKEEIFNKYISSEYQYFLDNKQGDLTYTLFTATGKLGNCLNFIPDLLTAVLMTMTISVLLISISLPVTLFLLGAGISFNFLTRILAKNVSYHLGTERVTVSAKANVIANEFFDGIKHIKIFDSFEFWQKNFNDSVRRFKQLVIKDFIWVGIPERFMQFLPIVILLGLVVALRYFIKATPSFLMENLASVGVYVFAFYRLVPFLTSFGRIHMQIMGILPDLEVLYDFLNDKNILSQDGHINVVIFKDTIKFEDVNFYYRHSKLILDKLSLTIKKGQITAIVGHSGSGKSTIVNLMLKLFEPSSGRITFDSIDFKDIKRMPLTKIVGIVSQETFIFNGTIKDNILFGLSGIPEGKIIDVAKLVNAHEFIMNFPNQYETIVGDKGLKLSGGQRQRLAIARAMLRDPQILVLDEATSSLDSLSEALVQDAINKVSKNRTVIIIAHRLSTIINANKIFVLDAGRLAEEGTHEELINKGGVYGNLYHAQEKRKAQKV